MVKICSRCDAVFDGHKWFYDEEEHSRLAQSGQATFTLCPGDERIEKRRIDGVVSLKSPVLLEHRQDAMNLIANIADRQKHRNVAARIFALKEEGEEIEIQTTDLDLAERIGKEFAKAFSGDLEIKWSKDSDFVRVKWQREK